MKIEPARFSQVGSRRHDMDPIGHFMSFLLVGAAVLVALGAVGIGTFGLLRQRTV